MTEQIAYWAGFISNAAMVVFWTAVTIENVAKGSAFWAAISSPFMLVGWLMVAAWFFGWVD